MSAAGGMLLHRGAMRERTSAPCRPQPVVDPKDPDSKDLDIAAKTRKKRGRLPFFGVNAFTALGLETHVRDKTRHGSAARTSSRPDWKTKEADASGVMLRMGWVGGGRRSEDRATSTDPGRNQRIGSRRDELIRGDRSGANNMEVLFLQRLP